MPRLEKSTSSIWMPGLTITGIIPLWRVWFAIRFRGIITVADGFPRMYRIGHSNMVRSIERNIDVWKRCAERRNLATMFVIMITTAAALVTTNALNY